MCVLRQRSNVIQVKYFEWIVRSASESMSLDLYSHAIHHLACRVLTNELFDHSIGDTVLPSPWLFFESPMTQLRVVDLLQSSRGFIRKYHHWNERNNTLLRQCWWWRNVFSAQPRQSIWYELVFLLAWNMVQVESVVGIVSIARLCR